MPRRARGELMVVEAEGRGLEVGASVGVDNREQNLR